jgi:serine/threonine protein kinase
MQLLQEALGRFISGVIDESELCALIRSIAENDAAQRPVMLQWIRDRVRSGRLPVTIGKSIELTLAEVSGRTVLRGVNELTRLRPRVSSRAVLSGAGRDDPTLGRPAEAEAQIDQDEEVAVGTILNARFTLIEELGGGGMGRVFKARDALLEEGRDRRPFVAVKIMSEDFKRHPDSFIALQREVKRTRELIHENVIRVYELHRDGTHVYMSMELLEGRPLDARLRGEFAAGLPLSRARPIILGIGWALQCGHKNKIVHSDLKPGNVFICDDGRIKVLDFGIARPMPLPGDGSDSTLFDPGKRLGALTPAYAALEMFRREPPDPRDDIYALACMTYELLAGRHPYDRKSAVIAHEENLKPQRIPGLTRPQWQAICRGLALQRGERTATVAEYLQPFVPASLFKRHRKPILAGAAALLAIGATVGAPYVQDWVDRQRIKAFQPEPPPPRADLTPQERQRISNDLVLANGTLNSVSLDLPPGEFAFVLSEGVNSANDDIKRALAIDPGNPEALALQKRIAKLYADKAQGQFDAGNFAVASELVGYGRAVYYSLDLYRLERRICDTDPASCNPMQIP